jgi:hypothetical protein
MYHRQDIREENTPKITKKLQEDFYCEEHILTFERVNELN